MYLSTLPNSYTYMGVLCYVGNHFKIIGNYAETHAPQKRNHKKLPLLAKYLTFHNLDHKYITADIPHLVFN